MIDKSTNPECLNEFLNYSKSILNKSPNTIKEYNYDLSNFFKFIKLSDNISLEEDFSKIEINDISIDDLKKITLNDLHAYLAYLVDKNNAKPATRARKVASLKSFFNYMTAIEKKLPSDPSYNLETPKLGKRLPKYLSLEDSEKLLNVTKSDEKDNRNNIRDYAIITLFLNCGMRLSELVSIDITDIDFSEEKLNIIGKGNKERTIYLNKACIKVIKDYLAVRPTNNIKLDSRNALFLSERKERISKRTVQHIVEKELQKAGLDTSKYSVHKLRHTAATLMYQYGGVDIRTLQELLGHESISTTEIYTHVSNIQVRKAVEDNPLASREIENKQEN